MSLLFGGARAWRRTLSFAALALCAGSAPSFAREARSAARPVTTQLAPAVHVARVLRESRLPDAPSSEELARQLIEPGSACLDPLLAILEERRVPKTGLAEDEKDQLLSLPQREIVLAGLALLDDRIVLGALQDRASQPPSNARAIATIDVISAVGDGRHLERLLDLAPVEAGEKATRAFGEAVGRILRRDEGAVARLPRLFEEAAPHLRPSLLEAIGVARDPRALPLLAHVIVDEPDLARHAIAQILLVGRSADRAANDSVAELLRERIGEGRPEIDPAAILALGELSDARAIARLVELLGHEKRAISENALWALRRATGQEFPADGDAWKRWYAREAAWFENELPQALRNLRSTRGSEVAAAIRAIGSRRLRRDELGFELASVLGRPETQLRVLVCPTLASLCSASAIEPLLQARDDANPRVAGAAAAALAVLSKADLPRDARRWSEPSTHPLAE